VSAIAQKQDRYRIRHGWIVERRAFLGAPSGAERNYPWRTAGHHDGSVAAVRLVPANHGGESTRRGGKRHGGVGGRWGAELPLCSCDREWDLQVFRDASAFALAHDLPGARATLGGRARLWMTKGLRELDRAVGTSRQTGRTIDLIEPDRPCPSAALRILPNPVRREPLVRASALAARER
jgi:hypothetical protein